MATMSERSDEGLVHYELGLERQYTTAKFQLATNQLEDSSVLKKLRREIARTRTEQRRREIEQSLPKDSLRAKHTSSYDPSGAADQGGSDEASGGGFLKGIVDKIGGNE